ncbi:MAG: glycosyltransferase [Hyphomicrobium sp.]
MTRVLHVISGLGTGGAESFLVALATRLMTRGFDQQVVSVTGGGPNGDRLSAAGIEVTSLAVKGPLTALKSYGPLLDAVVRADPDIIQGWMYHGDLFATAMHRLHGRKARLAWNIRCSDMRLEDYALQLRVVVKLCARLSKRPDVVLANSRAGAEAHMRAGYRPRRMDILPNGIDTGRFRPDSAARAAVRSSLGVGHGMPIILHVARVDPMKDHLTLLAAVEALDGAVLVLAGKGTEGMSLPPRVLGLGERSDVEKLMAAADIIVSSSAYGEGFSNAIAEGMSAGLIPVATDVGDVRDIIGDVGEIVPVRDPVKLREALARLSRMGAAERGGLGLAARGRIERLFSLDRAVDRFAALYSELSAGSA